MNRFQKFVVHTVMGIPEPNVDNQISITGEDIKKTSDPTQKFQKPYHLTRLNSDRPPNNVTFYNSEYDLNTIANARQLDGIINRAICVFKEQILKNGYDYVAKDNKAQEHIRKRIREIELFTGIKHKEIITSITDQLVTYANAYIIKVRKPISKYGRKYKLYNKTVEPIVGLFVAEATTMSIGLDPESQVKKYKQTVNGEERYFDITDVIHLTYNKIPGTLTGLTNINQVLDDVRALRKLEEEIEILGFQYAIPLYLYKVGTDTHPAAPGEVETASNVVNHSPTYGMMVVPHTHDIKSVTSEGDSIDVMQFVTHFKQRIFAGLGVSPVAMSEVSSSNRNTSEIADIQMQTITKSYQQILSNKLEQEFIDELLRDGYFNPLLIIGELRFGEIDLEAQIKKENHILQKYMSNLITFEEARLQSDTETTINEKDLYMYRVQIPLIEAEAKIKSMMSPAGGSSSSTSKSQKANKNSVSNKNRPTNQHGTTLGKPKIKKDFFDSVIDLSLKTGQLLFYDKGNQLALNRTKYLEKILPNIKDKINKCSQYTINSYQTYYHNDNQFDITFIDELYNYVELLIKNKINNIADIKGENLDQKIDYSLNYINEIINMSDKIENITKILTLKNAGYPSILYKSDNCEIHSDWEMNLNKISIEKIPPLCYGCNCEIEDMI